MGLTFLVFVQVETERYMSSLLKRLATIGAVFRVYFIGSTRLNSLCTLQAQSRFLGGTSLSDLDFNWYRQQGNKLKVTYWKRQYVDLE